METYQGKLQAKGFKIGIVVSRFNSLSELWSKTIRALEEGDRPAPAVAVRAGAGEKIVARCTIQDPAGEKSHLKLLHARLLEARKKAGAVRAAGWLLPLAGLAATGCFPVGAHPPASVCAQNVAPLDRPSFAGVSVSAAVPPIVAAEDPQPPSAEAFRDGLEKQLRAAGVDYLDAWLLGWVRSRWYLRDASWAALAALKTEGKTRVVGFSCHDRPLATALARELPIDVLMIRYNAAHLGAEREIFAPLAELGPKRPGIIAYTGQNRTSTPAPHRGARQALSSTSTPPTRQVRRASASSPHRGPVLAARPNPQAAPPPAW